ncbi:hypothetical protein, partial [Streptomyces tendae]
MTKPSRALTADFRRTASSSTAATACRASLRACGHDPAAGPVEGGAFPGPLPGDAGHGAVVAARGVPG